MSSDDKRKTKDILDDILEALLDIREILWADRQDRARVEIPLELDAKSLQTLRTYGDAKITVQNDDNEGLA